MCRVTYETPRLNQKMCKFNMLITSVSFDHEYYSSFFPDVTQYQKFRIFQINNKRNTLYGSIYLAEFKKFYEVSIESVANSKIYGTPISFNETFVVLVSVSPSKTFPCHLKICELGVPRFYGSVTDSNEASHIY